MEAKAVDRRAAGGVRVPIDVLVKLSHEGFDEPFEADCVNLGTGGLSMRAPYLPEVGVRLVCRFDGAKPEEQVEADAEVVWAADRGMHSGEFGLRFRGMPAASQAMIRSMVIGDESYRPPAPRAIAERTPSPGTEPGTEPGTARLRIDGVASVVVARIVDQDEGGVTLEQDLPFLRLCRGVTLEGDGGRRGHIESVDLTFEGEVPQLVLDVVYDPPARTLHVARAPSTGSAAALPSDAESTLPDTVLPDFAPAPAPALDPEPTPVDLGLEGAVAVAVADAVRERTTRLPGCRAQAPAGQAPAEEPAVVLSPVGATPRPAPSSPVPQRAPVGGASTRAAPQRAPDARATGVDPHEAPEGGVVVFEPAEGAPPASPHPGFVKEETAGSAVGFPVGLRPGLGPLRDLATRCAAVIPPLLRDLQARLRVSWARLGPLWIVMRAGLCRAGLWFRDHAMPAHRRAWGRARRVTATLGARWLGVVLRRLPGPLSSSSRRRTTAAPPLSSNVAPRMRTADKAAGRAHPGRRRVVRVALLAIASLGLTAYALAPRGANVATPQRIELPAAAAPGGGRAPVEEPRDAVPSRPEPARPQARPAVAPSAAAQVSAVEPSMPAALPEPSREAGPMRRPTFPSLREAGPSRAAAADSPYSVDVQAGAPSASARHTGRTFGAASVPGGRTFVIRMSRPVESIEGVALENGFRVSIKGSLSLDRAGPIAAVHPMVERSMILNRGDHAELTIDFVEGHRPAYRVEARGSAIEVQIGPR